MKLKHVAVAAFLVFANVEASAVTVKGTISCGTWVKERREGNWPSKINEFWVLGFLSGIAVARDEDLLKDADNESIYLWLDNYCRTNPFENLSVPMPDLYVDLRKRK